MIPYQSITYKESTICIVENSYSIEQLMNELSEPNLYAHDLEKLKTEHRKKEFLAIRIALKKVFKGEEKQIEYTYDGKPMLKDGTHKISFSHCQRSVAVMTHPTKEVGIDIEILSNKLLKIHKRFLGESELAEYAKNESIEYLRIAWSVKEALYKIIGDTAYNFAEQLQILPFEMDKIGILEVIHTDTKKSYFVNYLLTDTYTLAYCIDNE